MFTSEERFKVILVGKGSFLLHCEPHENRTPSFLAAALEARIESGSYKEFIKMIQNKGKGESIRSEQHTMRKELHPTVTPLEVRMQLEMALCSG